MKKYSNEFGIAKMAKIFSVSRSAYYAFIRRGESNRSQKNRILLEEIKKIHEESNKTYGSPRIHAELKAGGETCSRRRIASLMRKENIKAKMCKKWVKTTTASKNNDRVAPNILKQNFTVGSPNKIWISDITYISTQEGWLYLTVVMDLFSRKVVGMSFREDLGAEGVIGAFEQAFTHNSPQKGLIHHSDRGGQYTSEAFQKMAKENGVILSMSAKGCCYDNAVIESFFHTLKTEHVNFHCYKSREEGSTSIFGYVETFYNRKRRHSTLGYLSPIEFEKGTN